MWKNVVEPDRPQVTIWRMRIACWTPKATEPLIMCNYTYYIATIAMFARHELNELIGSADIVRFIKSRRMAWLGHVMRMDGGRMARRILEWKPMGRRIRGRPRKRWIEDVEEDIQTMGIRGWRKMGKERTEWKKITEKAKTHSGL